MKSSKPEGIWKSLRIVIILLVANILLVTNFYIYSMYINNQSMDLSLSQQSLDGATLKKAVATKANERPEVIGQLLGYDLPKDYTVSVKSITWPLTEQAIKNRVSACATNVDATQISSTVDSYQDVKGAEFSFKKEGLDGSFTVTVFPNKRFSALEDAQRILSICPEGGQLSPKALSLSAIMFTDGCGDKDCEQIRSTIEPTLFVQ